MRPLDLPYGRFHRIMGYKPNNVIQGFNILDEEKSERLMNALDLWSAVHVEGTSRAEYEAAVARFDPSEPLDEEALSWRRKEQAFLREYLFGKKREAKCGICGRSFPVEFLVAAHIKKRAECSTEEMLDFEHIVMPMCYFGCDRLYELGYLTVKDGSVAISAAQHLTAPLIAALGPLDGRKCDHWSAGTRPYFRWHNGQYGFSD